MFDYVYRFYSKDVIRRVEKAMQNMNKTFQKVKVTNRVDKVGERFDERSFETITFCYGPDDLVSIDILPFIITLEVTERGFSFIRHLANSSVFVPSVRKQENLDSSFVRDPLIGDEGKTTLLEITGSKGGRIPSYTEVQNMKITDTTFTVSNWRCGDNGYNIRSGLQEEYTMDRDQSISLNSLTII